MREVSGNMSKYSWASFVCLRFISICRNTCMHAQERSSWALIIQIARDSSFCQVLRGFSGWNHLKQCGLRGKKWSLSLSRLWHSFSVSNGWLLPDYSHGQSCYWSAASFHELRPNHTCCHDCYVNSYGWLGLWKVRSCFESKSCKISSWGYGWSEIIISIS